MTRAEIDRKEQELRSEVEDLLDEIDALAEITLEDGYLPPSGSTDKFSAALREIYSSPEVIAQINAIASCYRWFKEKKSGI